MVGQNNTTPLGRVVRDRMTDLYRKDYSRLKAVYPLAPEPDQLEFADADTLQSLCDAALVIQNSALAVYLWGFETDAYQNT